MNNDQHPLLGALGLCRKAAQTLGLQFELIINGTRLL